MRIFDEFSASRGLSGEERREDRGLAPCPIRTKLLTLELDVDDHEHVVSPVWRRGHEAGRCLLEFRSTRGHVDRGDGCQPGDLVGTGSSFLSSSWYSEATSEVTSSRNAWTLIMASEGGLGW